MTAPYRKKLIEVALPLKAINEASAREKSIRHGHPSTLHLWWARRPLAACRAVLFASLVDDPDSDPVYRKADGTVDEDRAGLKRAELFNLIEELVQWENSNNPRVINAARAEIARCVASRKIELGELAKYTIIFGAKKGEKHPKGAAFGDGVTAWDVLAMKARPEVVNAFLAEYAPPVLDPFCGGGSIPLEAQRLGLRAYASDLNPVPVLITKALIEIPPKFAGRPPVNPEWQSKSESEKAATVWQGAQGLAEDVRYYGKWMRDEAKKRIGHLYPKVKITKAMLGERADLIPLLGKKARITEAMAKNRANLQEHIGKETVITDELAHDRWDLHPYVGQELTIIAWLWARTVSSPDPSYIGVHVPLVQTFWLSKKSGKEVYLRPHINRDKRTYRFEICLGKPNDSFNPEDGTKLARGASFKCLLSGSPMTKDHIRAEFLAKKSGCKLTAIVVDTPQGRKFLEASDQHEALARSARVSWRPDADMNTECRDLVSGRGYGITHWHELFTERQLLLLDTYCKLIREVEKLFIRSGDTSLAKAYSDSLATYLAFAVSKMSDYNSAFTSWITQRVQARNTFSKQALAMIWDYCEVNPFAGAAGDYEVSLDGICDTIERGVVAIEGHVSQRDATTAISDPAHCIVSTDPPYYDNISYADLSDFFYLWLRNSLSHTYSSLFATLLTPKKQELIASSYRHDGSDDDARRFFEDGLGRAFGRMHDIQTLDAPLTVYYAFKQSETDEEATDQDEDGGGLATASTGWETMLSGLIGAGFSIGGTWPLRTERGARTISLGTNALASSIVLVCRSRPSDAQLATRKQLMTALRQELPQALKNLQHGNIAPVDLAQAAIGPGMAVFTQYAKVIESDGKPMTVRTALGIINQVLDEVLAEQEGDFDADTRWALAWFEQFGMNEEAFGTAETLSKAKNTAVNALEEAGILKTKGLKGKVRLLRRDELPEDWDPVTDTRLRHWEIVQHLIRTLETKGEAEAAKLLNRLGGMGETARELAYRLFSICERKKWADEALAYNSLVIAWPELSKLALSSRIRQPETQSDLFT